MKTYIDKIPDGAIAVKERPAPDGKRYFAIFPDGTTSQL
jgi:hypothetical protein